MGSVLWDAVICYGKHGHVYLAASLSFYMMLSLVPLAYIGLRLLTKFVGSSDVALNSITTLLDQYMLPDVTKEIVHRVSELGRRGLVTVLGAWWSAIIFLWSATRFYESLQHVMSMAWNGRTTRTFLGIKLIAVAAFIVATLFFGTTIWATASLTAMEQFLPKVMGIELSIIWPIVNRIVSYILAIIMFFLMYRFMPRPHPHWRVALLTAIPVGASWELMKHFFTELIVKQQNIYNSIYGPLGGFVLLMVWMYFSSSLALFGAEVGAAYFNVRGEDEEETAAGTA